MHSTHAVRTAFGACPTMQSHGHPFHDSLNKIGVSLYAKPALTMFAPAPVHCAHTVEPVDLCEPFPHWLHTVTPFCKCGAYPALQEIGHTALVACPAQAAYNPFAGAPLLQVVHWAWAIKLV